MRGASICDVRTERGGGGQQILEICGQPLHKFWVNGGEGGENMDKNVDVIYGGLMKLKVNSLSGSADE